MCTFIIISLPIVGFSNKILCLSEYLYDFRSISNQQSFFFNHLSRTIEIRSLLRTNSGETEGHQWAFYLSLSHYHTHTHSLPILTFSMSPSLSHVLLLPLPNVLSLLFLLFWSLTRPLSLSLSLSLQFMLSYQCRWVCWMTTNLVILYNNFEKALILILKCF